MNVKTQFLLFRNQFSLIQPMLTFFSRLLNLTYSVYLLRLPNKIQTNEMSMSFNILLSHNAIWGNKMWHVLMPFDLWVKRGARDEASIVWRCRSWCHHFYPLLLLTVTTVALVKRIYANGCHNDNNTRHAAFHYTRLFAGVYCLLDSVGARPALCQRRQCWFMARQREQQTSISSVFSDILRL